MLYIIYRIVVIYLGLQALGRITLLTYVSSVGSQPNYFWHTAVEGLIWELALVPFCLGTFLVIPTLIQCLTYFLFVLPVMLYSVFLERKWKNKWQRIQIALFPVEGKFLIWITK